MSPCVSNTVTTVLLVLNVVLALLDLSLDGYVWGNGSTCFDKT